MKRAQPTSESVAHDAAARSGPDTPVGRSRRRAPVGRAEPRPDSPARTRALRYLEALELAPTDPQDALFRALDEGPEDILLVAPTGTGKTLAAALPLLSALHLDRRDGPTYGVGVLVLAPTRALVDQHAATFAHVFRGIAALDAPPSSPLTAEARTGDTPAKTRASQKKSPPAAMALTPESLALVLGSDAREMLRAVSHVVLDEVHQLCAHKRGALLAVTLAALDAHVIARGGRRPRRVALTATANPASEIARWITGADRGARVLEPSPARAPAIELLSSVAPTSEPFPAQGYSAKKLLPAVARVIASTPGTTMVFVPSRPRAEAWTQALSDVLPSAMPVACFHGSMSADERGLVAQKLQRGELRAVVATSSLESGIDVPAADRVLFLGAPATITQAVQSAGRSGHRPDGRSHAIIACTDGADVLDAVAIRRCVERGEIEPVTLRAMDEDVLVQSVLALCALAPQSHDSLAKTLRKTRPFRALDDDALALVVDHLRTGGDALAAYDSAHRLGANSDGLLAFSDARSLRAYLRGVGTIVDDPSVLVVHGGRSIGRIEGRFAAGLEVGDRFALSGATWKILSRTPDRVEVARDHGRGPVARWTGARAARSELVAAEVARCYRALALNAHSPDALARELSIAEHTAKTLCEWAIAQQSASVVPTGERAVLECVRERQRDTLVLFTFAGASANDAIARAAAERWRAATGAGCEMSAADLGLALVLPRRASLDPRSLESAMTLFSPEGLRPLLAKTLDRSSLARSTFREVARVAQLSTADARPGGASPGLLYDVLRRHSPEHLLLRALDRALWSLLDGDRAERALQAIERTPPHFRVMDRPSPMSVPILARGERPTERVAPDDLDGALARAAHALWLRTGASELP
jgi:ATP-dependent Lhr-like helicase